jgi:uncharacterized protein YegJ (DUF2314 family)
MGTPALLKRKEEQKVQFRRNVTDGFLNLTEHYWKTEAPGYNSIHVGILRLWIVPNVW